MKTLLLLSSVLFYFFLLRWRFAIASGTCSSLRVFQTKISHTLRFLWDGCKEKSAFVTMQEIVLKHIRADNLCCSLNSTQRLCSPWPSQNIAGTLLLRDRRFTFCSLCLPTYWWESLAVHQLPNWRPASHRHTVHTGMSLCVHSKYGKCSMVHIIFKKWMIFSWIVCSHPLFSWRQGSKVCF